MIKGLILHANGNVEWKEVREYSNGQLEDLQDIVGGYIECVYLGDYVGFCNEEGWLIGLQPNAHFYGTIAGDVVYFKDLPDGDIGSLDESDELIIEKLAYEYGIDTLFN